MSEYERLSQEALELYGPSAVLFLQVGSFWELYWYVDKHGESKTVGADNARAVRDLLGLQLMNKGPKTKESPYMTGIPMKEACHEKINRVLDAGYVVCLGEQVSTKTSKGTRDRQLGRCFSPSMRMPCADADHDGNYACCVHVSESKKGLLLCGAALIDVSTGCSTVVELPHSLGDLGCVVMSMNVREVVLVGAVRDRRRLRQILDPMWPIRRVVIHDHLDGSYNKTYLSPCFMADALSRAYAHPPNVSEPARNALAYLLQFMSAFSLSHGEKLSPARIIEPGSHLSLSANALQQLGVHKLLGVLKQPVTPMGRRLFRERLCTPTASISTVTARHDRIQDAQRRKNTVEMRELLVDVGDLQRWSRKVVQRAAKLSDAPAFVECLEASRAVAVLYEDAAAKACVENVMESLKALDVTSGVLFPGNERVRVAYMQWCESTARLEKLRSEAHKDARLERSAEGAYCVKLTSSKWASLPEAAKQRYTKTKTNTSNSGVKIWNSELEEAASAALECERDLSQVHDAVWRELMGGISTSELSSLSEFVSDVDVTYACALNADAWGLTRPTMVDGAHGIFRAVGLGNPVAEHYMKDYTDEPFVKNDVTLDPTSPHMILLGLNGSGKSVLLKSVGMTVVMAQAGMFVPCCELTLSPFTRLDTRILTSDDIERGHSSYNSELLEMLQAIEYASPKSMFLADEMCSTTEWASAVSLVGQMIAELHDSGSTTLVTTHYHEILQHPNIKTLPVQIKHMSTSIVPGAGIVYDRTIADGPCAPSYGIRVAGAMGFSPTFIRSATVARDALMKADAIVAKKSRYNKAKVLSECEICGKPAVDTHHIVPQSEGTDNSLSNLMSLCKSCHQEAHSGKEAMRVKTLGGTKAVWKN